MKFVSIWKPDPAVWAAEPDEKQMAAMGALIGELMSAGVLLDTGGVSDGGSSLRVQRAGGKVTVTDGPFAETKELVGGFAIFKVNSRDEAVALTRPLPRDCRRRHLGTARGRRILLTLKRVSRELTDAFVVMRDAFIAAGEDEWTGGAVIAH